MIFLLSGLTAISVIAIMCKIGIKRFAGYPVITDLLITTLMLFLGAGTLTGSLVAIQASLLITIALFMTRFLMGFEKLTSRGWVYSPARWRTK